MTDSVWWFLAGVAVLPVIWGVQVAWSWIQYWRTPKWRR